MERELASSEWKDIILKDFSYNAVTMLSKVKNNTPDAVADIAYKLYYDNKINEAKKYFYKAFEQGHAHSGYLLATLNPKNNDLLYLSAEKGSPDAQLYLGMYYRQLNDIDNATKWLKKSAEHGNLDAVTNLGIILYSKKSPEAPEYIYDAAVATRSLPMFIQGTFLRHAHNKQWIELFQYSAAKANRSALMSLGDYYYSLNNPAKGYDYYEKASRLMDYTACLTLSQKLLDEDIVESYKYYLTALDIDKNSVNKVAADLKSHLNKKLTVNDKKAALKNKDKWFFVNQIRRGK